MIVDAGGASGHVNFAALLQPGVGNDRPAAERTTIRHSHVGKKGDLTVELHYGDFDTGHGRQAALYIWRNRGDEKAGVFVPLSSLWMFVQKEALHQMVPPLAEQLYSFVTHFDQIRVLDAIMDYLGDLQKSPPDPQLFKDKSLEAFQESCAQEGLEFFVDVAGKRVVG
jgi:hypothetical protein